MTDDTFKAPTNRRLMDRHDFEYMGPPKRKKTKEDFYAFCTVVMEYTQYERYRQEDMRSQNNVSPLDSSGSTASDTTFSTLSANSPGGNLSHAEIADSEDESWELITCFCLKPYAGRPMIECNECNTWVHLSCAKIRKTNIPDIYICQECKDSKFTTRKSNRVRIDNTKFTDEV